MNMRAFIIAVIALWALSAPAMAAGHVIDQKDLSFSQAEITIVVGDKIKFTNSDRTAHHIWTKDNGVSFSSQTLKPGGSYEIKFDKAGTYTVKCHIHPKMKLTIVVKQAVP
jgi:plastocyanin